MSGGPPINLEPLDPARVAWVLGALEGRRALRTGADFSDVEWETIRAALVQLSGLKFAPDYVPHPYADVCPCPACQSLRDRLGRL